MTITVDVPDEWVALLRVLGPEHQHDDVAVREVILELIDHAQQGVYRPGSWERPWLEHAFGDEWQRHLEPDPERTGDGRIIFQRPRRR
jgi:hypothetical protein